MLQLNTVLKELFPTKSKNLRELVAHVDPTKAFLLNQTDSKKITVSRNLNVRVTLVYFATRNKFKIRRGITCNTKNIIPLAYCKKCNKQGVGSCMELKPR